jgi:hypothetical protein
MSQPVAVVRFCDPDALEQRYLAEFLSEGRVPNNLFYLLNGANAFYSYRNADLAEIAWHDEVAFFRRQAFWQADTGLVFISLGCGNAGPEKMLLRQLDATGHDIHYVGVDSSARMLELAEATLRDEAFARHLVLGDFSQPDFGDRLNDIVGTASPRLYAMLGGTFGNFDQAYVARFLSRLIEKEDYLYLDIVPLEATEEKNMRLKDRLSHLPDNLTRFFDHLLSELGLSLEHGTVTGERRPDEALQTLRQTFYFEVRDPIRLSCLGEEAVLRPGQRIELLTIRAYDVPSLIAYMARHGFVLVDQYEPGVGRLSHRWARLLFSKSAA